MQASTRNAATNSDGMSSREVMPTASTGSTLPNLKGSPVLEFKDLAPSIHRQRLVVEGYPTFVITDEHIKEYLQKLSVVTDMITLIEPVTHISDLYGWAGWIHWETSGAHFYSWERPVQFFSVDIYTCKAFDPEAVVEFTREYFRTTEIVAKEF
ncbi:hypothetical protein KRMM14A1004_29160 [Krasilnikovia sp. MM14-A1004]